MADIRKRLKLGTPENKFEKALEEELLAAWYELSLAVNNSISSKGATYNTTRITTSPYTVLSTDNIIFCDTNTSAITVNLPVGVEGKNYKVINCGSSGNDVIVDGNGTEKVYGELTQTISDGEVINIHYNSIEGWY